MPSLRRPKLPVLPVLFAAAFLACTACSEDAAEAGKAGGAGARRFAVGATIDRLDNDYFVKIKQGIESRGKELGLDLSVQDARGRDELQLQQLESFIAQKVDAIVIAAVNDDVPAIEETVARARQAGIKVVAQSQRVKTADVYVSIRQRDYGLVGGRMAGEWIRDHLGGQTQVGVIGWPERPTIHERVQGLKDGLLEKAPNAKLVTDIAAPNAEKAQTTVEAALQQWPEMRVLVAFNDDTALSAANALIARFAERATKPKGEFAVFGLDAIPGALDAIADPKSPFRGTVDIDPYGNGRVDVDAAVALLEGKPIAGLLTTEEGQAYLPVAMKPVVEKGAAK
jgi:ABC-type sugar transport system substrate-binding protein